MKKTLVYAFDALEPNNAPSIASDLNNDSIGKIIIPTFLLKEIKRNYNLSQLNPIIQLLSESPKVEYIDFPTIYSTNGILKEGACYRNFVLCLLSKLKKYKNLFVKTNNFDLMLECIKRNFRIYIRDEYSTKLINHCKGCEYNIASPTKTIVVDTSYFVYMFENKIGLNILFDPGIKKLILSVNLEELIKIQNMDVFYLLIFLLNNRKKYNIKYIIENKAYDKNSCSYIHDLLIITAALEHCTSKKDLSICSVDLEFILQCLSLDINIIQAVTITHNNVLNDKKVIESLPVKFKKGSAYLSSKYISVAYENIASRAYSKALNIRNVNHFKVMVGSYVQIQNQKFLYRIIEINTKTSKVKLERTSLKA